MNIAKKPEGYTMRNIAIVVLCTVLVAPVQAMLIVSGEFIGNDNGSNGGSPVAMISGDFDLLFDENLVTGLGLSLIHI